MLIVALPRNTCQLTLQAVGDRWQLKPLAKLLSCDMEVLQSLLTTFDVDLDDERLEVRDQILEFKMGVLPF